jgi:undecaprenyl-diphosphatase
MNTFESVILGIIQGLGEFLPISSSGHLALVPWFFKFQDPGLAFDVALHIGTTIALIIFFWNDLVKITKAGVSSIFFKKIQTNELDKKLFFLILVATIPGGILGFAFEDFFEKTFRHPLSIAFCLITFGIILQFCDKKNKSNKEISSLNFLQAFVIGLAQSLALIPGVSRSGITITSMLLLGLRREDAARFSFLISTPIILGAGLIKSRYILDFIKDAHSLILFLGGFIASTIAGYFAIKFLLKFLLKNDFKVFMWYRIFIGALIIVLYFWK